MLIAKVETTPGTDAAPTAASNNIPIVRGFAIEPDGEPIEREIADGGFGVVAGLTSMKSMSFKVTLELRGNRTDGVAADISSGAIAQALQFDPLLRACDLAATYVPQDVDLRDGMVIYQPTIPTDEGVTLTVYGYSQRKVYKATGCKGSITGIKFTPGKIAMVEVSLQGSLLEIADAIFPTTGVWDSTVPPIWAGAGLYSAQAVVGSSTGDSILLASNELFLGERLKFGGTPPGGLTAGEWYYLKRLGDPDEFAVAATLNGAIIDLTTNGSGVTLTTAPHFLLDGWDGAVCAGANFNLGQVLTRREDGNRDSGIKGYMITGRKSTGDFTIESVPEATHPIWADWQAGTVKPLRVSLGSPAHSVSSGNRVVIEAKVRLGTPKYNDASGKRMMNVPFTICQEAPGTIDGSEFKLIFQ